MKIAYELLDERLNEDFQPTEKDKIYEYDDGYDDYIDYLVEKHK
jgi:hypothetical protein